MLPYSVALTKCSSRKARPVRGLTRLQCCQEGRLLRQVILRAKYLVVGPDGEAHKRNASAASRGHSTAREWGSEPRLRGRCGNETHRRLRLSTMPYAYRTAKGQSCEHRLQRTLSTIPYASASSGSRYLVRAESLVTCDDTGEPISKTWRIRRSSSLGGSARRGSMVHAHELMGHKAQRQRPPLPNVNSCTMMMGPIAPCRCSGPSSPREVD